MNLLIIQISDIHFEEINMMNSLGIEVVELKSKRIFESFKSRISSQESTKIVLIFSGDLADRGQIAEYETMLLFSDNLITRIKDEFPEINTSIIVVPGNHDVDFSDVNEEEYGSQNNYVNFLTELRDVAKNYSNCIVISDEGKTCSIHQDNSLGRVRFVLFNSSKKSLRREQMGRLEIDTSSFLSIDDSVISEAYGECDISIAVMHHTHEWFGWREKEAVKKFLEKQSDVVILGHEHNTDSYRKKNYDNTTNFYLHGAVFSEPKDREPSYFNILEINLESMTERYDVYKWNTISNRYSEIKDIGTLGYRKFERNRRIAGVTESCCEKFETWLNKVDESIKKVNGELISHEELFVFPDITLTHKIDDKNFSDNKIITKEKFIEQILTNKYIYLYGAKDDGKTATSKVLYRELQRRGKYPLYLTSAEMNSAHNKELAEFFKGIYNEQYKESEIVNSKMKSEKVLIVEFSDMSTFYSNKYVEIFSKYIETHFDYIIYTFDEHTYSFSLPKKFIAYLRATFTGYKLHKVGNRVSNDLLEKYFELSVPKNQQLTEQEWESQLDEFSKRVNYVFRHQLIDKNPLRILQVSSILITNVNQEKFSGKYSFLYNMLIDKELSNIPTKKRAKYKSILEFVAYRAYLSDSQDFIFDETCIPNALLDYEQYTELKKPDQNEVFNDLMGYEIIERVSDNKYRIRFVYMTYFFIATFIAKRLKKDKISVIEEVIANKKNEHESNILMFLIYIDKTREETIDLLLDNSKLIYSTTELYNMADESKYLEYADSVISKTIPNNDEIKELKRLRAIEEDEYERMATKDLEEDDQSDDIPDLSEIKEALTLTKILSEVIKNYKSDFDGTYNRMIVKTIIDLNLKIVGKFNILSEEIIRDIYKSPLANNYIEIPDDKDESLVKIELKRVIKKIITSMRLEMITNMLLSTARALDNDDIENLFSDLLENDLKYSYRVSYVAYKFEATNRIPITEIKELIKKFPQGSVGYSIIQGVAHYHLSNSTYYSIPMRQAVCDVLGLESKSYLKQRLHSVEVAE